MGDRTTCELTVWGTVPQETWNTIYNLMELDWENENSFVFHDMNYAHMDPDLEKALTKAGLSFIWANEAGADGHLDPTL